MNFPKHFIAAGKEMCTFEQYVPAPYLRKEFELAREAEAAELLICGLGFYRLFINGTEITKGFLAPYISNPDQMLYYDRYEIAEQLKPGKNVIGVMLGNGMQNCFGGYVWDFEKALWRSAPKMALCCTITAGEETLSIESDESFLTHPSPIYFDDLRCGEYYDARNEVPGWNLPDCDLSGWTPAIPAETPRGEAVISQAEPIVITGEIKPVSIQKQQGGYLYDFGVNCAGLARLTIQGKAGQEISLEHGEYLKDGELQLKNIQFVPDGYVQKDIYICKGGELETYLPSFTYHGFQYVLVKGITEEQATEDLLTYVVMNSDLKQMGDFSCSDETANLLQKFTLRSDLANFYYFPTDCPHREKNGWTGDAVLSAEQMLLNLNPEKSFREWMKNICKAQTDDGVIPSIVPTGDWGYGLDPAWDAVVVYLPYFTYLYRGEVQMLWESRTAIFRYLDYISRARNQKGLVEQGLGDWCHPGRKEDLYKCPAVVTNTIMCMDISKKAAKLFDVLGQDLQKEFAQKLYCEFREAIRRYLVDFSTMTVLGDCQTAQAMSIFYGVFEPGEQAAAFDVLLSQIERANNHMDTGVLGGRVLFHVLSAFGEADLAYTMITQKTFPSYGNWVARGATALWEDFHSEDCPRVNSKNHHFWGDISAWFIKEVAGIHLNPYEEDCNELHIKPNFVGQLDHAQAYHIAPAGKISVSWKREGKEIMLSVSVPDTMTGRILLPSGWTFSDGKSEKSLESGKFIVNNCDFI